MAQSQSAQQRQKRESRPVNTSEEEQTGRYLQTLANGLRVLGLFDRDHPVWSVDEIAQSIGVQKMTAYRLARTLEHACYLVSEQDKGRFHLGPAMLGAEYLLDQHKELARLGRPYLESVAKETGETVNLVIEIDGVVVPIDTVYTSRPFMSKRQLGCVVNDTANCSGKVFAAFKPPAERDRIVNSPRAQWTPRTIIDPQALLDELERVKNEGVAFDMEERFIGTCAVGAPVRNQIGEIIAAMSVIVPAGRFVPEERERCATAVKAAAALLSGYLGFSSQTSSY